MSEPSIALRVGVERALEREYELRFAKTKGPTTT
jgi:hypothetical protein